MSEEPKIDSSSFVSPSAQLFGNVEIGSESSIWPNVVIRAECQFARIGRYTNIQDFVMIHIGYSHATEIGDFCSITHHATVHGAKIEDDCLVGINAVVMDGVEIGRGSIVAGGAMIREDSVFPPGAIIAGVPAKQIGERDSSRANRKNAWIYHLNAQAYKRGEHRAWTGPKYERWLRELEERIETDSDLAGLRADSAKE
ncbi:MAG: gamma carbonic anhydrase family protein [Myxococcales bacterium]|nr:gamma carbonic anhydrase family protein [Myxococcales bacterium]HIK85668.1 gamma carbonic anhydrase family protein [Myxococcales bacterium]